MVKAGSTGTAYLDPLWSIVLLTGQIKFGEKSLHCKQALCSSNASEFPNFSTFFGVSVTHTEAACQERLLWGALKFIQPQEFNKTKEPHIFRTEFSCHWKRLCCSLVIHIKKKFLLCRLLPSSKHYGCLQGWHLLNWFPCHQEIKQLLRSRPMGVISSTCHSSLKNNDFHFATCL